MEAPPLLDNRYGHQKKKPAISPASGKGDSLDSSPLREVAKSKGGSWSSSSEEGCIGGNASSLTPPPTDEPSISFSLLSPCCDREVGLGGFCFFAALAYFWAPCDLLS
ncbi:hypothetical protein MTO96_012908 [Rhipicephalus appendiculatus]